MTQRTIQHKPSKIQALIWFLALLIIPFVYIISNKIEAYYYNNSQCAEPRRREWSSFNVPIPPAYSVHGLDVSHYQCQIDWAGVKKMNVQGVKVDFVFLRATRGVDMLDYQFHTNWQAAKKAGILRGAYHFYFFNKNPAQQAEFFLKNVTIEKGDLPPVLDIEFDEKTDDKLLPQEDILRGIATWLIIVEKKTGVKPIIYANLDYYNRYISHKFPDYKIWIANYNNRKGVVTLPDGRMWSFWQTHTQARCNGISEPADFNVFSGTQQQLMQLTKQ